MISENTIRSIATKYQTTEVNIRREYVQHLFLLYFYQQPESEHVFFKGGTALRLIYQSPRFSEDLDFTSSLAEVKNIENAIQETLAAIEKEGIQTDIKESKETTGGYLGIINFKLGQQVVDIQIEISFRDAKIKGEAITVSKTDLVPSYVILQLALNNFIAEKIQALLTRKKPRDFYDLYFLLRSALLPPEVKSILPEALKVLKKTEINFEVELKQFLPYTHWAIIRDFKTNLEKEIEKFI